MKRVIRNSKNVFYLYRDKNSLGRMIRDVFKGSYRPSFGTVLVVIAGLLYILSPIDLISDFIPVIGWLDDGTILYLTIKQLRRETQRYGLNKNRQNS